MLTYLMKDLLKNHLMVIINRTELIDALLGLAVEVGMVHLTLPGAGRPDRPHRAGS